MREAWRASASEIAARVRAGEVRAVDVIESHLERIALLDGELNAFISVAQEPARSEARRVDALVAKGEDPGRLAGVPVAVKDNIVTRGLRTTCASKILERHVPLYDATAVARLRAEGAIVIGKTNMDEFAMGSSTENSCFGPTRNPWATDRVPGGSSGGSAAAVAARMAPVALGSDTGGSVRQPGAFCGVLALKPTYGTVSRYGLVAFASSLDQIGVFARSAADVALVLDTISGHDERDATSLPMPPSRTAEALASPTLDGIRVGVPRALLGEGVSRTVIEAFDASIEQLRALGAVIVDVTLMDPNLAVATYYVVAGAEASSNLARYDGVRYGHRRASAELESMYAETRTEGFGMEVKRRILLGTYVLSSGYYDAYYDRAMKVRHVIRDDLDRCFRSADVLCLPTTPSPAFRIGEIVDDPLQMYLQDIFTITANLTSYPAISMPAGFSPEGLPIGTQLIGRGRDESTLIRVAAAYAHAAPHAARAPEMTEGDRG
jgi:aspartyl-tRNA(Asn)/glutamyl-tRNA(Gln) amidotransferase subunit A